MPDTCSSSTGGKALARVLRLALNEPLQIEAACADNKRVTLGNSAGKAHIAMGMLQRAARDGLLKHSGNKLAATAESRTFLKRQLAGAEDDFAAQHGEPDFQTLDEGQDRRVVRVNLDHSPLAALSRLKDRSGEAFLPPEALSAGERLHVDFTRGQLQPRVTQTYEPRLATRNKGERGGIAEISDSAMAARLRVSKALDAVGPELSGVVLDVCCFMKGLETVERERQWPARSAKLMLRTGLMTLHRHYVPPPRSSKTRHWGEEGYRPGL